MPVRHTPDWEPGGEIDKDGDDVVKCSRCGDTYYYDKLDDTDLCGLPFWYCSDCELELDPTDPS